MEPPVAENSARADSFLRLIRRSQRGKLKIYLGYSAGVGKTYQMLEDAQQLRRDGADIVAGVVETHGRSETRALLGGLESIPMKRIEYRGIEIEELDLDAVIARKPEIVLVDELAHTNAPGSPRDKRYMDVDVLLEHGIHVISTLNIQHVESLYETVEAITGVKVHERIPDRIIMDADQIVNIDVTTEDLRRRLREGKVYTRERVEVALDNFFRHSNLEQLRELALRELAFQIDVKRRSNIIDAGAATSDRVMVCLSSRGPNSDALLRYGSRLAGRLNRKWHAVYIQTEAERPESIDAATQRSLANTLTLASQLGATVHQISGRDIAGSILKFAQEYGIGQIVIGAPGALPSALQRILGKQTIIDKLLLQFKGKTLVVVDTRRQPE